MVPAFLIAFHVEHPRGVAGLAVTFYVSDDWFFTTTLAHFSARTCKTFFGELSKWLILHKSRFCPTLSCACKFWHFRNRQSNGVLHSGYRTFAGNLWLLDMKRSGRLCWTYFLFALPNLTCAICRTSSNQRWTCIWCRYDIVSGSGKKTLLSAASSIDRLAPECSQINVVWSTDSRPRSLCDCKHQIDKLPSAV